MEVESRENAEKAFDQTLSLYNAEYPKAMDKLKKDRGSLRLSSGVLLVTYSDE